MNPLTNTFTWFLEWSLKKGSTIPCRDSLLVRASNSWSKGCKFESWQKPPEFSPPELTLCANSYSFSLCLFQPHVTAVARKRPWSFCQKCRWQVTPQNTHNLWSKEVRAGWLSHCLGMVWGPIWKRANTQLVREHFATDISACWATVDGSWHKEWS